MKETFPRPPGTEGIAGFPRGAWEDLVRLSDSPRFTAYPNPCLAEFVGATSPDGDPPREPYAADVSEGKNDPYYGTLNYHTKVPPLAIARYILHYTRPGEVVLDCFCGSGMTGLAAALCGAWPGEAPPPEGLPGARRAVLVDLSPVATFLSHALTRSVDGRRLAAEAEAIAAEAEAELGSLYRVAGSGSALEYAVWSDVFICPYCSARFTFWEAAIEPGTLEGRKKMVCPRCGGASAVGAAARAFETRFDPVLGRPMEVPAERAVRIFLDGGRGRAPSPEDEEIAARAAEWPDAAEWVPVAELPAGRSTEQPRGSHRIRHVHQFYTWRNLRVLAWLHRRVRRAPPDLAPLLTVIVLALHARASRRNRHIPKYGHRHVGVLSGTLYVPPLREENNLIDAFRWRARKAGRSIGARHLPDACRISTQSATDLRNIPSASVDYAFIDPPFGSNIMYSELNYLWEAWLGAFTDPGTEVLVDEVRGKGLPDYGRAMAAAFQEIHRVLKPGRWMTLVFHNSRRRVWASVQEALAGSGLAIADVRTLDKVKGSIKQLSSANSARRDIVVSALKPGLPTADRAGLAAGSEEMVWELLRSRLAELPVPRDGAAAGQAAERRDYVLYDRMLAFHIGRGLTVPLSAPRFYAGLRERFPVRDGMHFLPEQAAAYDAGRGAGP